MAKGQDAKKASKLEIVQAVPMADLMAVMRHHYPHPNGCIVRKLLLGRAGCFDEQRSP